MGRIVAAEYMTLDGVIEAPELWVFPYWHDELGDYTHRQLEASDALLLGRKTYEIFASSWPSRPAEDPHAARMNAIQKYVVSSTLERAEWNKSTILQGNAAEACAQLRAQAAGDLLIWGSGLLVRELLAHGLIDELRIIQFPIIQGSGARLFEPGLPPSTYKVADVRTVPTGVTVLCYAPA